MQSRETLMGPSRKKTIGGGLLINVLLLSLVTGISEESKTGNCSLLKICYKTKIMYSLSSQKWPPLKKIYNLQCKVGEHVGKTITSIQRRNLNSSPVQVQERAVVVPLKKLPPIFKKINNLYVLANNVKWESMLAGLLLQFNDDI